MVYILHYIINYNNDLILNTTEMTALEYTAIKQCFVCGVILGLGDASVWVNNTFIIGKHLTDTYDRLIFTIPLAKGNKFSASIANGGVSYHIFSSN